MPVVPLRVAGDRLQLVRVRDVADSHRNNVHAARLGRQRLKWKRSETRLLRQTQVEVD